MNCWKCGLQIDVRERVGMRDYCPRCDRPLHSCRNCEFYDPSFNNQCREPMAERVVEKERANFCDYFAPRPTGARPPAPTVDARETLDALFKKRQ